MADNYLEKKMEEMRQGSGRKFRTVVRKTKVAFVTDALSEQGCALLQNLHAEGVWHLVMVCSDLNRGREMSQRLGARFYRVDDGDEQALEKALEDTRTHFFGLEIQVFTPGDNK